MGSGLAPLKLGQSADSDRSGRGPAVGLGRMHDWLLLHGFRSQATGDRASGGLGGFCRVLRRLQHCGHEWEGGFPEKEAGPPVARVSFGKTRGVGHGVPRVLCTSAGAVAGRGAQTSPIVVMGSHERAAGRDSCHASGPRRSAETPPSRLRCKVTDGNAWGARPRCPFARITHETPLL